MSRFVLGALVALSFLFFFSPPAAADDPRDPTCMADCAERATALARECVQDGNPERQCRLRANGARISCVLERCEPGRPPCEEHCATRASAFYVRCQTAGEDPRECKARASRVETACVAERCDEPCICPDVFDPVCGQDGMTYGNACESRCAGVGLRHDGECREPCACPEIYVPVCGVDGETYPNACEARCADVDIAHRGECTDACICPRIYAPVCGVDGETYPNACEARCADVDIAHRGECTDVCLCPRIYAPVCGVNGVTYPNACQARCADVDIAHEGECILDCRECRTDVDCRRGEVCNPQTHTCEPGGLCAELGVPSDICPLVLCSPGRDPVCGVDGQTHTNACIACCIDGVEIAHEGECRDECPPILCDLACEFGFKNGPDGCPICECNEPCLCTEEYQPVCGVDGTTYSNRCFARCADVEIAHEGECRDGCRNNDDCPAREICYAPTRTCIPPCTVDCFRYDPVCGADGVTYGCGEPDATCHGVEVAHEGECGVCFGDQDCTGGTTCNAAEICLPPPGCEPGDICPAVCTGHCVPAL